MCGFGAGALEAGDGAEPRIARIGSERDGRAAEPPGSWLRGAVCNTIHWRLCLDKLDAGFTVRDCVRRSPDVAEKTLGAGAA